MTLCKPGRCMDCRIKSGNDETKNVLARASVLVIARSDNDEIQHRTSELDCFADARNDEQKRSRGANASELCDHQASSKTQPLARRKRGERSAERRIQPMSAAQTACATRRLSAFWAEARHRQRCLRNASACGARSPSGAPLRLSSGL
jgi:hypothetical protein